MFNSAAFETVFQHLNNTDTGITSTVRRALLRSASQHATNPDKIVAALKARDLKSIKSFPGIGAATIKKLAELWEQEQ